MPTIRVISKDILSRRFQRIADELRLPLVAYHESDRPKGVITLGLRLKKGDIYSVATFSSLESMEMYLAGLADRDLFERVMRDDRLGIDVMDENSLRRGRR